LRDCHLRHDPQLQSCGDSGRKPTGCNEAEEIGDLVLIMNEDERQLFHIFLGACSILLVLFLGIQLAAYVVGVILVLGLMLVHMKLSGMNLGPLENLVQRFERPGITPGYGAMTIAAGTLAILTLLSGKEQILASLVILGIGDAASTLVGRRSRKKLPYCKKKTFAGTAAFFVSSLPAIYFAGLPAILVAAAAALAESLETNVDDNLVISFVCVVAFKLIG
jgi:dolichol kinase